MNRKGVAFRETLKNLYNRPFSIEMLLGRWNNASLQRSARKVVITFLNESDIVSMYLSTLLYVPVRYCYVAASCVGYRLISVLFSFRWGLLLVKHVYEKCFITGSFVCLIFISRHVVILCSFLDNLLFVETRSTCTQSLLNSQHRITVNTCQC